MKKIIILVPIVMVLVGGCWMYQSMFGPTEQASGPTTAAPLANAPAGLRKFQVSAAKSKASFIISEVLMGSPKQVIGTTSDMAGEVGLNLADLSSMRIGEIRVNARTLKTDDDRRNGMLGNQILSTRQFEFLTFTPTQIIGLSGAGAPGANFDFMITGDLSVRGVAKPVTFTAKLGITSASEVKVTAKAAVRHADFGISIPRVPSVASVGDDVRIEIEGVAVAAP